MNIQPIFETQRKVDEKIAEKYEGGTAYLDTYESIDHRQFAFKVEVMELANEIGFFKDWKHSHVINISDALEELADCIAFLASVGISQGYSGFTKEIEPFELYEDYPYESLFDMLCDIGLQNMGKFTLAFSLVLGIGLKLGASESAILFAYQQKASKNIERQEKGY